MQYHIFGLHLESTTQLRELRRCPSPRTPDVAFRLAPARGSFPALPPGADFRRHVATSLGVDLVMYRTGRGHILQWEGLAEFVVSEDGSSISCCPLHTATEGFIRSMLYGPILSYALHLRGVVNLHAGAVCLPHGAVGFVADPGTGKSTLAASFVRAGYPLLTDDVLPIRRPDGRFLASAGFPWVGMTPQSLAHVWAGLGRNGIDPDSDKVRVYVDGAWGSFQSQPAPLVGLYLLHRGGSGVPEIDRLPPQTALRELLDHTNCVPLLEAGLVQQALALLAPVAASVPVYRLRYPSALGLLPSVIDAVLENERSVPVAAETGRD